MTEESKYDILRNAQCLGGFERCWWAKLGRSGMCMFNGIIDEYGRLFSWGRNSNNGGQGFGDMAVYGDDVGYIDYMTQIFPGRGPFKMTDAGENSAFALTEDGTCYYIGECWYNGATVGNGSGNPGPFHHEDLEVVAGGMRFSWIAHNSYVSFGIHKDTNKLYYWGTNVDHFFGTGAAEGSGTRVYIPTLHPILTQDFKIVDCEYSACGAVTTDNRVYVWGNDWYGTYGCFDTATPIEVTGLPVGVDIVDAYFTSYGIMVLLENGELWCAGSYAVFGDWGNPYTGDMPTFQKHKINDKGPVSYIFMSGNALVAYAIVDGNIWGWGDGYCIHGNGLPDLGYEPQLCASGLEGEHNWIAVANNTYNLGARAINDKGYVWTWGYHNWGPMLAIGNIYDNNGSPDNIVVADPPRESYIAPGGIVGYESEGVGPLMSHNTVPSGLSEYIQPIEQLEYHKPCGHWHERLFDVADEWPQNCWMTSLYVRDGTCLFVACGRWLYPTVDTGNQVIMLHYSISSNTWTQIMYEEPYHAANYPGGCFFHGDVYCFMNWKVDVTGTTFNEVYSNPGMGVWVVNNATGAIERTTFADSTARSGRDKIACHSSGAVVIAYENGAGQLLIKVSTDYGATWVLRKTVAADPDRNDWAVWMDDSGYIYLAHQFANHYCMIERSINFGLAWTTQDASDYTAENMQKVKLSGENGYICKLGEGLNGDTDGGYYRYSSSLGASWGNVTYGDGYSLPGHAGVLASGRRYAAIVDREAGSTRLRNYSYNEEISGYETTDIDPPRGVSTIDSSMSGHNGVIVYTAYGFYTTPRPAVALMISQDQGKHWYMRATPLKYYRDWEEISTGYCDPVFSLAPPGNIDAPWTAGGMNWADNFVKQGNKW